MTSAFPFSDDTNKEEEKKVLAEEDLIAIKDQGPGELSKKATHQSRAKNMAFQSDNKFLLFSWYRDRSAGHLELSGEYGGW